MFHIQKGFVLIGLDTQVDQESSSAVSAVPPRRRGFPEFCRVDLPPPREVVLGGMGGTYPSSEGPDIVL